MTGCWVWFYQWKASVNSISTSKLYDNFLIVFLSITKRVSNSALWSGSNARMSVNSMLSTTSSSSDSIQFIGQSIKFEGKLIQRQKYCFWSLRRLFFWCLGSANNCNKTILSWVERSCTISIQFSSMHTPHTLLYIIPKYKKFRHKRNRQVHIVKMHFLIID